MNRMSYLWFKNKYNNKKNEYMEEVLKTQIIQSFQIFFSLKYSKSNVRHNIVIFISFQIDFNHLLGTEIDSLELLLLRVRICFLSTFLCIYL
jgi:hypothetical protein